MTLGNLNSGLPIGMIGRVGRVLLETRAEDFIGEGVVLVYQGPDVW